MHDVYNSVARSNISDLFTNSKQVHTHRTRCCRWLLCQVLKTESTKTVVFKNRSQNVEQCSAWASSITEKEL